MMSNKALILAILVAVLVGLLYEPIPKGYSTTSSIKLRILAASKKVIGFVGDLSDAVNPGSQVDIRRTACRLGTRYATPPDDNIRAYDTEFDGVQVRIYEPLDRKGKLPGIVYYHGGGFVICDIESHDRFVRRLAHLTNTVIASVNYRLAPEHYYPAAHDDCFTATKYFIKNSNRFNVDHHKIAVAGDSAGGNLAATTSLRFRDANQTSAIKLQVLIFPTVQFIDIKLPSMVDNKLDPTLRSSDVAYYYSIYLNAFEHLDVIEHNDHVPAAVRQKLASTFINLDKLPSKYTAHFHPHKSKNGKNGDQGKVWAKLKATLLNPYFAPLLAPSLEGLPKAYVYTCEHDVLRDDGFLYAERLREAGVDVEHFNDPIGFHTNVVFALDLPEVQDAVQHIADYISSNL